MRTRDEGFLKAIRELPCIACGGSYDVEAHHVKTRGSGGGDDPFNIIPLCTDDHTQAEWAWHRNLVRFLKRYPYVLEHLRTLGWKVNWGQNRVVGVSGLRLFHPAYRDADLKEPVQFVIGR